MSSTNANGSTGVTAESYGSLDTSQVSNEVWMVRIPPKLAAIWNEASEGTVLGELVFTKGGKVNGEQKKASLSRKHLGGYPNARAVRLAIGIHNGGLDQARSRVASLYKKT